jgi:hypothetical protein
LTAVSHPSRCRDHRALDQLGLPAFISIDCLSTLMLSS